MTGRVDIVWRIFKKTAKTVTSFLTFCNFFKNTPQYIDPSGHFVFYENFCSSNFLGRTSPRCCSRGSPGGWIKISFYKTYRYLPQEDSLKKITMIALLMREIFNFLNFGKNFNFGKLKWMSTLKSLSQTLSKLLKQIINSTLYKIS